VFIEVLDWESGLWCPECLLPSGLRLRTILSAPWGLEAREFGICNDCAKPLATA
jgi:hypothetical protein